MAKDPMFQSLCSTSTWKAPRLMPNTSNFIFSCASELHAQHEGFHNSCGPKLVAQHKGFHNSCVSELFTQHKYKHSCVPELPTQHKHQILMFSIAPCSTQTISLTMCFRVHPEHMKSYIKHMQLAYTQYIKKIIMFSYSGVLDRTYQLKHQSKIISNGAYAHKYQVKIWDITIPQKIMN